MVQLSIQQVSHGEGVRIGVTVRAVNDTGTNQTKSFDVVAVGPTGGTVSVSEYWEVKPGRWTLGETYYPGVDSLNVGDGDSVQIELRDSSGTIDSTTTVIGDPHEPGWSRRDEPVPGDATYNGYSRADYIYNGDNRSTFLRWQAGDMSTERFQTRTPHGQGTAALELAADADPVNGSDGNGTGNGNGGDVDTATFEIVTVNHPEPVDPGSTFTYAVTVQHSGGQPANATVTANGQTSVFDSLAPGTGGTVTFNMVVPGDAGGNVTIDTSVSHGGDVDDSTVSTIAVTDSGTGNGNGSGDGDGNGNGTGNGDDGTDGEGGGLLLLGALAAVAFGGESGVLSQPDADDGEGGDD